MGMVLKLSTYPKYFTMGAIIAGPTITLENVQESLLVLTEEPTTYKLVNAALVTVLAIYCSPTEVKAFSRNLISCRIQYYDTKLAA